MSDLTAAAERIRSGHVQLFWESREWLPTADTALADWLDDMAEEERSLAENDGFDPWVTIAGYAQAKLFAAAVMSANGRA